DARFVDYGVGSLQGLMLLEAINRDLGLGLKMPVLYDHSSIRDLAAHIARSHGDRIAPIQTITPSPTPVPATPGAAVCSSADIAVVGLAARFPGAEDAETFWRNLRDGVDSVGEIPATRIDLSRAFDTDRSAPGRTYSRWAGTIAGIDEFD